MAYFIKYLALFFGCFAFSGFCTGLVLKHLRRKKIMDIPNARSNHKQATPRGGGIVIMAAVFLSFILLSVLINGDFYYIGPLLAAALLLAAVSWVDDLKNLHIGIRLCAQLIAVSIGLYIIVSGHDFGFIPLWPAVIFIALIWLWFINLYNFMDGIDGITGIEAISIALGIIIITRLDFTLPQEMEFYAAAIIAISLGFLIWNWAPARIFMGDIGSIPLGFLLGWLLLELALRGHIVEALIIPAYYLSDSTYTITRRLFRRQKIWQAHSEHFYQQAVRSGRSHSWTALRILGVNICLLVLVTLCLYYPAYKILLLIVGYGLTAMTMLYFAKKA